MKFALGAAVVGMAAAASAQTEAGQIRASEEYPDFYAGDTTKGIDFVQSIEVLAPAYCSNIKGDVTVVFKNVTGSDIAVTMKWGSGKGWTGIAAIQVVPRPATAR